MFSTWPLTFNTEQATHWGWLTRVTEADIIRFDTKYRDMPAPEWFDPSDGPCQMWIAGTTVGGQKGHRAESYGSFWIQGHTVRAHIFAALVLGTYQDVPHMPGLHVDHRCVRPLCVARLHLEPVPREENERRKR